jgi:hypothetical protein
VYVPDRLQTPAPEGKKELQLGGYFTPEHFLGLGVNGSYTFSNHFYILANHFQERASTDSNGYYKYNFTEAGLGLFYAGTEQLRAGISASFGIGKAKAIGIGDAGANNYYRLNSSYYRTALTFYALQKADKIEVGIAGRVSKMYFNDFQFDKVHSGKSPSVTPANSLFTKQPFCVEPVAVVNQLMPHCRLSFQLGLVITNAPVEEKPKIFYPFVANFGLSVDFFTTKQGWHDLFKKS